MISNSLLADIKDQLGANYREEDNTYLMNLIGKVTTIALSVSNRSKDEKNIELLAPYICECVVADYLNRGGEGLNSLNDGGKSSSFKNNRAEMRSNIIKDGLRIIF